jgi:AraC family transcriptional regulator
MADRIVIRRKGILGDLSTPGGASKLLGTIPTPEELILEEHDCLATEFPDSEFLTHMISVTRWSAGGSIFWRERGVEKRDVLRPGGVFLSTAKPQTGFRWDGPFSASVMSIGLRTMEQALPEPFTKPPIELISLRAGKRDPVLEHLIGALGCEFERRGSPNRLLLECLGNGVACYLARRYGSSPPELRTYKSGLSRERLRRIVDYIEAHLGDDLSVRMLSNIACLSPYHFGKMFKRSTNKSVHQYVMGRRIECAKSLLRAREPALSEIALSVGFQDQSQFGTAFKHFAGLTPAAFRRDRGIRKYQPGD